MTAQRATSAPARLLSVVLVATTFFCIPGCIPIIDGDGNTNVNDNTNNDGEDNANVNDNDDGGEPVAGLPLSTFTTDDFTGSGLCAPCHGGLTDGAGNDVSIDAHWRSTMMANAATDPLFLASVSVEVEHAPGLQAVIEDVCITCHMPMARTQAVTGGSDALLLDDGFLDTGNPLHTAAMEGVSCTLCHQITNAFVDDEEGSFDGGFHVDTGTGVPDRLLYGPYTDLVQPGLMQSSVGFLPIQGKHVDEAGLCATCHTLFTPTLDAQGEVVGEFPEQVPFLEWSHSDFGDGVGEDQACQGCHMPVADGAVANSIVPGNLDAREPFYQHHFVGGNVVMLSLLRDNIEDLSLTASTEKFNDTIARTEDLLQNNTAGLSITEAVTDGEVLELGIEVTNETGHKFPTGFPSRQVWIHLTVADGEGTVIFESGTPQANGSITGNDADSNAALFELHHDVITSADQVQIYEAVMIDSDSDVTNTLLRAATYVKDNRILPQGFDKETAEEAIAVHGDARTDPTFVGGSDHVEYRVDVSGAGGPFTVEAKLLYKAVSFRYATEVAEGGTSLADQYGALADAADKTPTVVAAAETAVVPE